MKGLLAVCMLLLCSVTSVFARALDWQGVEKVFARKGMVPEKLARGLKGALDRTDYVR